MPLLQLKQVTLRYHVDPLLDGVDFQVEPGERVCLLGRNGAGKTSLMRIITGEEKPHEGETIRPPGTVMTRLTQEIPHDIHGKVIDVIHSGLRADRHEEEWETDVRLEELIAEMRLPHDEEFAGLSGGLKRRVLLAKALAGQPDVLLLDEPTNHLDLESILWLEEFLLTQSVTLFFVTHDRAFLRKLATRIVELDRGRLTSWSCNYDTYLERKAAALESEEKQWANFDKKLAQEEAWLRQGVKARRTRNEGRVRSLEKMRRERSQRRERLGTVKLEIQEGMTSGQKVIEAKEVSFGYGGEPIVQEVTTTIWRGDKIGIIGPNGAGKSTLLKLLLGQLQPQSGEVKQGTNLEVVYLDQLRDQIDDEKTLAQNVAGNAETVTFQGRPRHIHSYLQDFLFRSDRVRMPAKVLSGGERNRLLLARLFLQPANVLVLDEPTNDLDAETMELLEELLVEFTGTLLLVSHDRVFLNNVVTNTLVFEGDGRVAEYSGGYEDWVKQSTVAKEARERAAASASKGSLPVEVQSKARNEKAKKFSQKERKELEELPSIIEKMDAELLKLTNRLASPELYQKTPAEIPKIQKEIGAWEHQISLSYSRWEELEEVRKSLE